MHSLVECKALLFFFSLPYPLSAGVGAGATSTGGPFCSAASSLVLQNMSLGEDTE